MKSAPSVFPDPVFPFEPPMAFLAPNGFFRSCPPTHVLAPLPAPVLGPKKSPLLFFQFCGPRAGPAFLASPRDFLSSSLIPTFFLWPLKSIPFWPPFQVSPGSFCVFFLFFLLFVVFFRSPLLDSIGVCVVRRVDWALGPFLPAFPPRVTTFGLPIFFPHRASLFRQAPEFAYSGGTFLFHPRRPDSFPYRDGD